ncbi:MAG: cold shock domain-containing protein [Gammaproteobacteria bacterium]|nr:cold shock domain-containing protein [Gammaproteobacteria bacterium]
MAASGSTSVALLAGGVILISAFTSSLLASWWNGGEVVAAGDARGSDEGVVKWFNVAKGFGFITVDNGADIFVHFRDIRGKGHRSLTAGQRVAFEIKETDKGPQAHEVTVIGAE